MPIKLISTDFDGTLYAESEHPPVPPELQQLLGDLQRAGAVWVINTGRDLSSVLEGVARARLSVWPDYLVTVEREIHRREGNSYVPVHPWNVLCADSHRELFARIEPDVPRLVEWVNGRFSASIYRDPWSPFCVVAESNADMDAIQNRLSAYSGGVPGLSVMRNDVYARFCHASYNKGTALAEIARLAQATPEQTLAAGDHMNDLPMLSTHVAGRLVAPDNAVAAVKETVRRQNGYVSHQPWGHGVARGLEHHLGLTPG
ncbi:MAG: HAD family phosphatase [Verrucomicrobia bacterium]|nr:HAD family phosphatase [Verrucomicrobiota bacterium]